eukprot:PhM_4_TR18694/c0_g1_i1/m.98729
MFFKSRFSCKCLPVQQQQQHLQRVLLPPTLLHTTDQSMTATTITHVRCFDNNNKEGILMDLDSFHNNNNCSYISRTSRRKHFYENLLETDTAVTGYDNHKNKRLTDRIVKLFSASSSSSPPPPIRRVLDLGAGTGRGVIDVILPLLDLFGDTHAPVSIHCVEENPVLCDHLHRTLRNENNKNNNNRINGDITCMDLVSFFRDNNNINNKYDLIVCLGVLMYLTDEEVICVLRHLMRNSKSISLVQEDISGEKNVAHYYASDGGVCRTLEHWEAIFDLVGNGEHVANTKRSRDVVLDDSGEGWYPVGLWHIAPAL